MPIKIIKDGINRAIVDTKLKLELSYGGTTQHAALTLKLAWLTLLHTIFNSQTKP